MSSRPPSQPPELPGYQYEQLLGSGGFADVFLYRQERPQRRVAIKVLLSSMLDDTVRRQFDSEANVMATMSTHPSIVTIYQADVSSDNRPYLVMEFCSRPNYGVRFRKERISTAEALRVGVQVAGAVETSHRAGILHRDIKPANILVTDYNRPALTDFGISIAAGQSSDIEDSQGMSIPWSPPEVFGDPPRSDVRSDVFSLAATIYSLLASRTPFERTQGKNTAADLIERIEKEPLPPIDRPDVPDELNRVLAVAMAKDPAGRYDSALAFGRALQHIEMSLALPVTNMDVLDDHGTQAVELAPDDDPEYSTRMRQIHTFDPQPSAQQSPPADTGAAGNDKPKIDPMSGVAPALNPGGEASHLSGSIGAGSPPENTMLRPAGGAAFSSIQTASSGASTQLRPAAPAAPAPQAMRPLAEEEEQEEEENKSRVPRWPFVVMAVICIIGIGVGSTFAVRHFFSNETDDRPDPTASGEVTPPPITSLSPPGQVEVHMVVPESQGVGGRAQVSWNPPPEATEDVYYEVTWDSLPANYGEYANTEQVYGRNSVVVLAPPNLEERCVRVVARTRGGVTSAVERACLEPPSE